MRVIRVLHNYGGALTNERRIAPGDYVDSDERLLGIADYLVENGHAEVIAESPSANDTAELPPVEDGESAAVDEVIVEEEAVADETAPDEKPNPKRNPKKSNG